MTNKFYSFKYNNSTNIGDEIQTLAAINAMNLIGKKIEGFVDRDNINLKNINLIINGFFTPESSKLDLKGVNPIFSNLHIARWWDHKNNSLLSEKSINFLKEHQPIGCRDKITKETLDKMGVETFFNYCLTLTFPKREKEPKKGKIFIVDIDKLAPIPKNIKEKAEFITHYSGNTYSHELKIKMAQELLDRYKNEASLIITSRLHCALPCIAMGIPVIFFADKKDKRLHLVQEFITHHPYQHLDPLWVNSGRRVLYFFYNLFMKLYYHTRYYFYYKNIDYKNVKSPNIEKTKIYILNNLKKLIKDKQI